MGAQLEDRVLQLLDGLAGPLQLGGVDLAVGQRSSQRPAGRARVYGASLVAQPLLLGHRPWAVPRRGPWRRPRGGGGAAKLADLRGHLGVLEDVVGLVKVRRARAHAHREHEAAPSMQDIPENVRDLALAVRHEPLLRVGVLLVPPQSLQAPPERHERGVDGDALLEARASVPCPVGPLRAGEVNERDLPERVRLGRRHVGQVLAAGASADVDREDGMAAAGSVVERGPCALPVPRPPAEQPEALKRRRYPDPRQPRDLYVPPDVLLDAQRGLLPRGAVLREQVVHLLVVDLVEGHEDGAIPAGLLELLEQVRERPREHARARPRALDGVGLAGGGDAVRHEHACAERVGLGDLLDQRGRCRLVVLLLCGSVLKDLREAVGLAPLPVLVPLGAIRRHYRNTAF
mmetsp:Transcript_33380/g.79131  ORF Transcript_33380/g.79131 Transcript_33380/m.79131 type:complete len:403 (+) Transcript_33380:2084-3292(+)